MRQCLDDEAILLYRMDENQMVNKQIPAQEKVIVPKSKKNIVNKEELSAVKKEQV